MSNFVFYVNPVVTLVSVPAGVPALYSLATAAHLTGMNPEMLRHYCRLGLLGAARRDKQPEPTFDDDALYEIRRIEHCRRHHGAGLQVMPLICDLWREVDRLQAELRFRRNP